MDYDSFRHFADSWVLLAMVIFFVGVIAFVWRRGSKKLYEDAANIPFKDEG